MPQPLASLRAAQPEAWWDSQAKVPSMLTYPAGRMPQLQR